MEIVIELVQCDEVHQRAHQVVELRCPSFHYASDEGSKEDYGEDLTHVFVNSCTENIVNDACA